MRTGIFGGTFDPVHNGHLICADAVRRQLALDKVVFVPAGVPPHKIARRITPPEDRLAMLRAAIGEREGFAVSDIECRRRKYTYTYDTLIELRRTAAADEEFYWIIGADTLADVFNWYRSADVFRLCAFAAMKRPGCDETVFQQSLRKRRRRARRFWLPTFRRSTFQQHRSELPPAQERKLALSFRSRSGLISGKRTYTGLRSCIFPKSTRMWRRF